MSIKLRKATIATAIENVAQRKGSQEGSYQGPRVLSDEPVQAVLDLSSVRVPVRPFTRQYGASIGSGGPDYHTDLMRPDDSNPEQEAPTDGLFSFLRLARVTCDATSATSGGGRLRLQVRDNYGPSGPQVEVDLYAKIVTNGDELQLQYNYDAIDIATLVSQTDQFVPPSGFVFPPSARLTLEAQNFTDDTFFVNVMVWGYTFDETDLII